MYGYKMKLPILNSINFIYNVYNIILSYIVFYDKLHNEYK